MQHLATGALMWVPHKDSRRCGSELATCSAAEPAVEASLQAAAKRQRGCSAAAARPTHVSRPSLYSFSVSIQSPGRMGADAHPPLTTPFSAPPGLVPSSFRSLSCSWSWSHTWQYKAAALAEPSASVTHARRARALATKDLLCKASGVCAERGVEVRRQGV
jgi:hypothetical protein